MKHLRNIPLMCGCLLLALLLGMLLLPNVVTLKNPGEGQFAFWIDDLVRRPPLAPMQNGFLLGTDRIGRDMLARLVFGARNTLMLGIGITLVRSVIAVPIGLAAGRSRSAVGTVVQFFASSLGGIPTLIAAAVSMGSLRLLFDEPRSWYWIYASIMVMIGVPRLATQMANRTRAVLSETYIEAAVALGAPARRILSRHVLPNLTDELLVMFAADCAWTLLTMGQLAVLGVMVGGSIPIQLESGPPTYVEYLPEWGQMLGANVALIRTKPWVPGFPALAIALSAICFQLLAAGLRKTKPTV